MKSALKTVVAMTALCAASAQAGIINGSFEDDFQAAGTWGTYANLTGWIGGGGGIELRNNVEGTAHSGSNYIELDTSHNSLASQLVTTEGAWYNLSFAYSPRMNVGAGSNGIDVYWNGSLVNSYTGNGTSTGNDWTVYTVSVLGWSPVSWLQFVATGTSDSLGGSLDSISITRVPEPGTLALLGLGILGIGLAARRRRT